MDVLLVTRFYPPDTGGGGIAAYARYTALGLSRLGHQVRVISELAPGSQSFQTCEGIPVYRIPSALRSFRWTRLPGIGRHVRFLRDLAYAWRLRRTIAVLAQSRRPDIAEYADIDAEGLFHNSARPYVIKLHTPHRVLRPYYSPREAPYARRGIEALEKFTIRRASGLSSPSRTLAKDVARLCGLDESRIICVPNPIDTDFFSPGPDHENDQIVLYVGRLEPRKGAVVFAHAIPIIARACPGVRFLYAGVDRSSAWGHSQKAELEQYLNQEGLADRVRFQGHASPEVFREYYRRATVFVMPSLFENCPYTLLEAMACGKAVVASRAGGMPEMVAEGESGLLFEAGNSDALAEAVIALLNSPARRARLGAAARRVVEERYALNVAAEATLSFYRRVLAERANR